MIKLFLAIALLTLFTSCSKKESDPKMLVIGTSVDNPPFEFYHNGEMTGFDIEFGKILAKKLNREAKFIDMSFDTIIAALQSKKIDIALAAISPTEERAKSVDFTCQYHESSSVLVTPGFTDVTDFKKLHGQIVGVQLGSTHEHYAKAIFKKYVNAEIRSLGKVTDLIQELRVQRIAGLITGIAEADKIIEMNPSFKAIKLPESLGGEAVALPKDSRLTKVIGDIIITLEADGTLEQLRHKWKLH